MKRIFFLSLITAAASLAQDPNPEDIKASGERGKVLYMTTCVACHQPTGAGLPGAFPPFDGSEFVTGDTRRLVAIVIKGLNGPITVKGAKFPGAIPLIPVDTQFPQYKDNQKLADVLNYIRTAWSNKADKSITPDFIQKVRDEFKDRTAPWTEADVLNFPAAKQ